MIYWSIADERYFLSLCLFLTAVVTDVMDGRIARSQGNVTDLGGLFDHATDCLFVVCALYALSTHEIVPWQLSALVAAAFVQYALDSGVLKKKGLVPSKLGRWNGIAYFVLVAIPIVQNSLKFQWISDYHIFIAGWAMCAMTGFSMLNRIALLLRRSRSGNT